MLRKLTVKNKVLFNRVCIMNIKKKITDETRKTNFISPIGSHPNTWTCSRSAHQR